MRKRSELFYLAVFALFGSACGHAEQTTKSTAAGPDVCAIEPNAIVSDTCASFGTVDELNAELSKSVRQVTQSTDFFSYYRLNLFNRECPFWDDGNGMCGNRACAVDTLVNEEDIPAIWRAEELGRVQGPQARHPNRQEQRQKQRPLDGNLTDRVSESCVIEYDDECDDRDYCVPEDETASVKGDYVSLADNPEKFTGYSGESANMVWNAIYDENCFSSPSAKAQLPEETASALASQNLRSVLQANSDPSEFMVDENCVEKRVFYRVISGMHASISAHLCYDYLDQKTGTWGPNLTCYEERLEQHPDRVSNLYFNYGLMVRAVAKLQNYLRSYTFCTGDVIQDRDTKSKVLGVAGTAAAAPTIFDESIMFQDPASGPELKEDFRQRFRNVSRLMDCVGCDKCRLWGKVQTAGYGTALKILFEYDEAEDFVLKRTELVSLLNTLDRIGTSINSLARFRELKAEAARDLTHSDGPNASSASKRSSPSTAEKDGDDGFDDFELPEAPGYAPTVSEVFKSEFDLIFRTTKYVLQEWAGLPSKFARLAYWEAGRVWWIWLGVPVEDRPTYGWRKAAPLPKEEL